MIEWRLACQNVNLHIPSNCATNNVKRNPTPRKKNPIVINHVYYQTLTLKYERNTVDGNRNIDNCVHVLG